MDAGAVHIYDGLTGQYVRTLRNGIAGDQFGAAIAGVGDLLAVGAPYATDAGTSQAGLVHVYDPATGTLVRTLRGFTFFGGGTFGFALAAIGDDLLVGAPRHDYLFSSDAGGVFRFDLATGNPVAFYSGAGNTGDSFGQAIAVDGDRIFIGAPLRDVAIADAGAIYVYDGVLNTVVAQIANPTPVSQGDFGSVLAGMGGNVAASANSPAGTVIHFLNGFTGALIRTHAAPAPGTAFGYALAGYSDSLLVVGAPYSNTDFNRFGAAYVVDAFTGAIVQAIASPAPVDLDNFGTSLALFDGDILVGAPGQGFGATVGFATLVKGPRISDVAPLATLINLQTLSLANNRIASPAPLASLINLRHLDLHSNQITGGLASLTNAPGLARLDLTGNPLDNASHTTHLALLTATVADLAYTPNQAPVLPAIAPRAAVSGAVFTVNLNATDPDSSDTLHITAVSDSPHVSVIVVGGQLQVAVTPDGVPFTGVASITTTVHDGPSGAQDGRGRSATRTFAVNVGLSAISGVRFEDHDSDGVRDPNEPGIAGTTVFLELFGDVNLDQRVDGDEYFIIDRAYVLRSAGGWVTGDADFSGGPPTAEDYFAIDRSYLMQRQGLANGSPQPLPAMEDVTPVIFLPGTASVTSRLLLDGSFNDPSLDLWTATVDYGDGAGTQELALRPDKTFTLDHIYAVAGQYQVRVNIRDSNYVRGSHLLILTVEQDPLAVPHGIFGEVPISPNYSPPPT